MGRARAASDGAGALHLSRVGRPTQRCTPQPQPLTRALTYQVQTFILTLTLSLTRRVLWLGALAAPRSPHTSHSVLPCDPFLRGTDAAAAPSRRLQTAEDLHALCLAHHLHTICTPVPVPPIPCKVVEYLRGLLDATAATLSAAERTKVEASFLRAVDIEVAFFDNAYASA